MGAAAIVSFGLVLFLLAALILLLLWIARHRIASGLAPPGPSVGP